MVCELKEKSLKIKCFFASSIPHSVTYFWNKMKKKTFMIFHSFPPKFLTHISDFPAWFIFLNLLMSCSSLVWDFDRVNIGNPPTNCSSSDMSVGATFHIIQLLANFIGQLWVWIGPRMHHLRNRVWVHFFELFSLCFISH